MWLWLLLLLAIRTALTRLARLSWLSRLSRRGKWIHRPLHTREFAARLLATGLSGLSRLSDLITRLLSTCHLHLLHHSLLLLHQLRPQHAVLISSRTTSGALLLLPLLYLLLRLPLLLRLLLLAKLPCLHRLLPKLPLLIQLLLKLRTPILQRRLRFQDPDQMLRLVAERLQVTLNLRRHSRVRRIAHLGASLLHLLLQLRVLLRQSRSLRGRQQWDTPQILWQHRLRRHRLCRATWRRRLTWRLQCSVLAM